MGWNPVLDDAGVSVPGETFHASSSFKRAYTEHRLPDDIAAEQDKVRAADAIVFQFPLWWYGVPAILKGWFDRVFHAGFAFGTDPASGVRLRFEQGPFRGKRALVVATLGDRPAAIGPRGISGEFSELMFGLLHGTLAYTGMSVLPPLAIASADRIDDATFVEVRRKLLSRRGALDTDAPIDYRPQFQGDYTDEWELAENVAPGESGLNIHIRR